MAQTNGCDWSKHSAVYIGCSAYSASSLTCGDHRTTFRSWFSLSYHVSSRDCTQVFRLSSKYPSPTDHFPSPRVSFVLENCILAQTQWLKPVILEFRRLSQKHFHGLHREFQVSIGYKGRPCLKAHRAKEKQINRRN